MRGAFYACTLYISQQQVRTVSVMIVLSSKVHLLENLSQIGVKLVGEKICASLKGGNFQLALTKSPSTSPYRKKHLASPKQKWNA